MTTVSSCGEISGILGDAYPTMFMMRQTRPEKTSLWR